MIARYRLNGKMLDGKNAAGVFVEGGPCFVEFEHTPQGLAEARQWRADRPQCHKGRRIRSIIQARPSEVKTGLLYEAT